MPSKWLRDHQKQEHEEHKKRIKNMRSLIDTTAPREMPMSKRNEIERQRKRALIEQDNRLLLDRLAIAMQTKNIDNHLVEKPFISLMELQRKKELKKIMIQNSRLLDRIQSTVPSYDHVLWEKEADHHVEILRNMTEFPELFVAPGTHKKGYDMRVVDAERAMAKAEMKSRSVAAGGEGEGEGEGRRTGTAGTGGQRGRPGTSQQGFAGDSPNSHKSSASGFVPYSYFPEEQYAQYQRNLQMQMQMQMQQQQQAQYNQQGQQQGQQFGYGVPVGDYPAGMQQQQQQQLFMYHNQQQQGFQQPQQQRQAYPGGSVHSSGNGGMNGGMLPPAYGGMNAQFTPVDMGGNGMGAGNYGNPYYGMNSVQEEEQQGGVRLPDIYQGQGSPPGGY